MKKLVCLFFIFSLLFSITMAYAEEWVCSNCGKTNTTNFCTSCGTKRYTWNCPNCGAENTGAFCGECGTPKPLQTEQLTGTWLYSKGMDFIILQLKEDHSCCIRTKDGIVKGTYDLNDVTLSITTSNELNITNNHSNPIIGTIYLKDGALYHSLFGTGLKDVIENPENFMYTVAGHSMDDTLPDQTYISFGPAIETDLKRNDILAVNFPGKEETIFVKRLVGLPGETIALVDGYLYINGEKQNEIYINDEYRTGRLNTFGPYTIPDNEYFVLGDHRNNSNDSRSVGPLGFQMIVGVMLPPQGVTVTACKVTGIHWERIISIEKKTAYSESGWELPDNAIVTEEKEELHHYDSVLDHYEDTEVQHERQVIDNYETYYTYEDNKDGTTTVVPHERPVYKTEYYTETVSQPVYRQVPKYQTKYYYTIYRWTPDHEEISAGEDQNPYWPDFTLQNDEREGKRRKQTYSFMVSDGKTEYTFNTNENDWHKITIGNDIYIAKDMNGQDYYISDSTGNKIDTFKTY